MTQKSQPNLSPTRIVQRFVVEAKVLRRDVLWLAIALLIAPTIARPDAPIDRSLEKEIIVEATLDETWDAWTTNEGARTFFASRTNIYAKLGAPYEPYFFTDEPYGLQGAEGCRIHSFIPKKLLAFTWNTPPQFSALRAAQLQTIVYLQFEALAQKQTRVRFTQLGWGVGEEWDAAFAYFDKAWDVVLGRLKIRFASGPIDWNNPPRPAESLNVVARQVHAVG